jgi:hypothetical protein
VSLWTRALSLAWSRHTTRFAGSFRLRRAFRRPATSSSAGQGLGAAISAMEGTTGRECVWATAQYLSYAKPGDVVDIDVTIAVDGHQITQARAVCRVADREILTRQCRARQSPYGALRPVADNVTRPSATGGLLSSASLLRIKLRRTSSRPPASSNAADSPSNGGCDAGCSTTAVRSRRSDR